MIGDRIKAAREAAGMSQSDLARAAGVQRQLVSRWENGTHNPGLYNSVILARVLNIPLENLMKEKEETT